MKIFLSKIYARLLVGADDRKMERPLQTQKKWFFRLLRTAKCTAFGQDHGFSRIKSYEDFKRAVPVRTYEDFEPYIERVISGEKNVLWKGLPLYLAKTSGTTSGAKYIPITRQAMPYFLNSTKNMLLRYILRSGNAKFVGGKMIFLQGSPELEKKNGIYAGRLSGITAHYIPFYLQKNRLPSWKTNCMNDWEDKVDKVVEETIGQDMTLISGIPSWLQMYFEKLVAVSGKKVGELFPNFQVLATGGVNFEPYRKKFEDLIGRPVDVLETYPASEGFIGASDGQGSEGLLLMVNSGIFYEFIPSDEYYDENPTRISLQDVQLGVNYALILNTNSGLWGYSIGDTVEFISKDPYRIIVTGRIAHYTSAFGEHVIAKEVEKAVKEATEDTSVRINEFTLAPQVNPWSGLPYHEWLIEFEQLPEDMEDFAGRIDRSMQRQNMYYKDLVEGNILREAVVTPILKDGFNRAMKQMGKFGEQNKMPRLANDRRFADLLWQYTPKNIE